MPAGPQLAEGAEAPAKLAEGVVRLGTPMVNWYLVADESGVTVVDAGCPKYRPQLEPGLELLGRPASDIKALVLTHSDGDHIGVAEQLRSELGIPVFVDSGDEGTTLRPKPKKTDGSFFPHLLHPTAYRLFWHLTKNGVKPKAVVEVTTYGEGPEVDVPGRPTVIPTPGHTAGHVALHFPSHGALFVGDTLCTWNPMTGRRGSQLFPRALNANSPQARESLAAIEGLEADLVLPGHGEPWTAGPDAAVAEAIATGPS
jgi:glyoxylase-like metal-dependent hydrolase (beta-lactamase superfamily II)